MKINASWQTGLVIVLAASIVGTAGLLWHFSRPNGLNASLRDSCGAGELLIGVRGSGETDLLGDVIGSVHHRFSAHMQPVQVAASPIDYIAVSVSDLRVAWMYDKSYAQGKQQLINNLYYWNHKCPNYHFVLAGYSQGADVVASVITELNVSDATESTIFNKIDGVALLGDPRYNPYDTNVDVISTSQRPGILSALPSNHAGARPTFPSKLAGKVRSWCRNGDPVCQVTDSCKFYAKYPSAETGAACGVSIGRAVGQHTSYGSGGQTEAAGAWLAERAKASKLKTVDASFGLAGLLPTPSSGLSTPAPTQTHGGGTTSSTQTSPAPSPTPTPTPTPPTPQPQPSVTPPDRKGITSYNHMQPGAPHHGYFASAWQNFTAASNAITYLSATVGSPGVAAGATVGTTLTLRLCTTTDCSTILAEAHPQIVNYGETGADIGDIAVTPGATYYIEWYQPAAINGQTWVTYWWAGGTTISTSDQLQAVARGYNR